MAWLKWLDHHLRREDIGWITFSIQHQQKVWHLGKCTYLLSGRKSVKLVLRVYSGGCWGHRECLSHIWETCHFETAASDMLHGLQLASQRESHSPSALVNLNDFFLPCRLGTSTTFLGQLTDEPHYVFIPASITAINTHTSRLPHM